MTKYALDTNTISYILKEDPVVVRRFKAESAAGNRMIVPLIAYYEIKRGLLHVGSVRKMQHFELFCSRLGVDELRFDVLDKAAGIYDDLRRKGRLVDDADIIIAAQCVVNGYALVTNNTKHFEHITGLKHVDWRV